MTALAPVLLVGVGVRLVLLLQWPRRLNTDEATAGLMGLHVLRGEFPAFIYSVAYQGALESYLTAVVYAVAGASPLTLKIPVFLFSCLLVVVTFLIGQRLGGRPGGVVCALLVAVGPPFLPVYGNYPMLGYMEVVVVGSLVLLLTLDLVTGEGDEVRRTRRLGILGLLAGLGWWLNPMMLSYLAVAGLFLVLSPGTRSVRGLAAATLAFVVGSLPFWIFNLTHAFWSFDLFQRAAERNLALGLHKAGRVLPAILGVGGLLTDPVPWLSPAAGVVYAGLLAVVFIELARRLPREARPARVRRQGVLLLLVFALAHLAAFVGSGFVEFATYRYLFPLYSALPILAGMAVLALWRWSRPLAAAALAVLVLNNGLALWKTAGAYEEGRRRDWWKPEPVVALLEAAGMTRAYAEERIAPRLTFETRERIVVADYETERYHPYLRAVDTAPRIAYVLFRKFEPTPDRFEAALAAIGATYRREDVGGGFSVVHDFRSSFEGRLVSLSSRGWRAEAEPSGAEPGRAFDRDPETAWHSEAAMRPGMSYRLDLGDVTPVGGITAIPVRPRRRLPAGYRIDVSADGAVWDTVASVPEFGLTLEWRDGQPRLDRGGRIISRFAPRPIRYLRVAQTGSREEPWAIAEIFVYGPAAPGGSVDREPAAAHVREGLRLEKARQWGAALAAYERAVRLDSEWEEPHWRIVGVYGGVGLAPEGTDPYRRGLVFERLGLPARAAVEYERLLAADAEDGRQSDPLRRLGEIYQRQGRLEDADRLTRRLSTEYAPPNRAEAGFGGSVRLLGYGLEPAEPRAGDVVELSYYWQALGPMAEDLTVFVHFVRDGRIHFAQDHAPLHGRHPTSRWRAGELVREHYRVRLPRDLPPAEYEIRLGLWNPQTGKRLRVQDTALPQARNDVRVATVRIRQSPLSPTGGEGQGEGASRPPSPRRADR